MLRVKGVKKGNMRGACSRGRRKCDARLRLKRSGEALALCPTLRLIFPKPKNRVENVRNLMPFIVNNKVDFSCVLFSPSRDVTWLVLISFQDLASPDLPESLDRFAQVALKLATRIQSICERSLPMLLKIAESVQAPMT